MKKLRTVAASTALLAAVATYSTQASASTITAYDVEAGTAGSQNFPFVLAMDFVVNDAINVLSLGAFDDDSDGITANSTLTTQLWSRNGQVGVSMLAQAEFTNANQGTLSGGSRFLSVGPALLLAPGEYSIVSFGYNGFDQNGNAGRQTQTWSTNDGGGALSFVGLGRFNQLDPSTGGTSGNPIGDTADSGPADRYAAGSFQYTIAAVPLPGGVPLYAAGLAAFGFAAARKKRKSA